jgi:DNA polymerase III epsilon subunit-like protein
MVPFQYSLNIVETPNAEPIRFDFIYEGTDDPRKDLMNELRSAIHPAGSIVAYNAAFEKSVLKSCASVLPEFTEWVEEICQRFVDLLQPFKSMNYYPPLQNGSASLKTVLPILAGKRYGQIKNGEQAQQEYISLMCGNLSAEDRAAILNQLKQYCYTDSIGMFWIIKELKKLVGE